MELKNEKRGREVIPVLEASSVLTMIGKTMLWEKRRKKDEILLGIISYSDHRSPYPYRTTNPNGLFYEVWQVLAESVGASH